MLQTWPRESRTERPIASRPQYTAANLGRALRELADPEARAGQQRFFKESVRGLGVRTPDVRRLATRAAAEYRRLKLPFDDVHAIAERLWREGVLEERVLAVFIVAKFIRRIGPDDWSRVERWAASLSNWAETDGLSVYVVGPLLERYPELIPQLTSWTDSAVRCQRRAAAVALVPLARRGLQHDAAYAVCERLAEDRDDLVVKAVGWLLKEVARTAPQAVADYLLSRGDRFSRTSVRIACEKMPAVLRKQVMGR